MKVAINGFGRIGRSVFRVIAARPDSGIEVVAISPSTDFLKFARQHRCPFSLNVALLFQPTRNPAFEFRALGDDLFNIVNTH